MQQHCNKFVMIEMKMSRLFCLPHYVTNASHNVQFKKKIKIAVQSAMQLKHGSRNWFFWAVVLDCNFSLVQLNQRAADFIHKLKFRQKNMLNVYLCLRLLVFVGYVNFIVRIILHSPWPDLVFVGLCWNFFFNAFKMIYSARLHKEKSS